MSLAEFYLIALELFYHSSSSLLKIICLPLQILWHFHSWEFSLYFFHLKEVQLPFTNKTNLGHLASLSYLQQVLQDINLQNLHKPINISL